MHAVHDWLVVGLGHEASQRTEPTDGNQLEVGEGAFIQSNARQVIRLVEELRLLVWRADAVDQATAVGRNVVWMMAHKRLILQVRVKYDSALI